MFLLMTTCGAALLGCSESSADDPPDDGAGGGEGMEPGNEDPCEAIAANECEADERCMLATTFDCDAWADVSYCVSKDADCESARSSRGVALYTNDDVTEGQCYEFESRCYTGRFREPEDAECEVCDF